MRMMSLAVAIAWGFFVALIVYELLPYVGMLQHVGAVLAN